MSDELTVRRPAVNACAAASSSVFALLGAGYLASVRSTGAFGLVLGFVNLPAGLIFALRAMRAGATVASDGLHLRSTLRTRFVSWSEFKSAVAVPSTGPIPAVVLGIELRTGRIIRVEEVRSFGWMRRGRHKRVDEAAEAIRSRAPTGQLL